ncbi:LysR substrate-binding domain-containing protein [Pararhodobacter sp. CCB-MM2]|uniref:LysR substrate-binding domain-containing protein n=1 Tax=Pararhodobacter sp. CCB-MM2 TaxID=1786003 RepID=UPI00083523A5|nr:LysR substrate-binding domain-containing protein [Pararhodobacter sp. CCB-MM2]
MKLPPLNALRAFESAARNGGYVAASAEMGVTPAAVSQQVRKLEEHLGRRLFTRHNNRVTLTDAGQAIYAETAAALSDLAQMAERAQGGRVQGRLVVSCLPSLAEGWLMSRLGAEAPLIDLRLESDPVAFARDGIDLRLSYGTGLYPDLVSRPLFRDTVLPLAAPTMARHWPDLPDDRLIHTDWGPGFASHPTWAQWFAAHAPDRPAPAPGSGHRIGGSFLALQMAERGLGVALGQRALAEPMVEAGRLTPLSPQTLPLGHDYVAIHPHAKARKPALQRMLALLGAAR